MRCQLPLLCFLTAICFGSLPDREARAGGGPENLMLVVNADDPSSMLIANHYVQLRNIPSCNVVYLRGVPQRVDMALETFQLKIMTPILKRINQSGVNAQIDYIVYSSGFPTVVKIGPHVKKLNAWLVANGQTPLPEKLFKPMASLTAATYFFSQVMKNDPSYISLTANGYMSGPTNVLLRTPFVGDEQIEFDRALQNYNNEQYDETIKKLLPLQEKNPGQVAVSYWLARCYGMKDDAVQANEWIAKCIRQGWCYAGYTRADPAFESLSGNPMFVALLKRMPDQEYEYLPTRSFRSQFFWGRNGFPNSAGQGHRYVLSTMLSVTRGLGMSERQSLDFLKTTVRADHSHPEGVFYFSQTSNVRTTTRMASFTGAIEELARLGFQGKVIQTVMPMKKKDVLGATLGVGKLNWKSSQSRIIPGAIVENLTSFGGKFGQKNTQTNASHFLKYGAAGSSGTVVEPYAVQAKFPHPRIQVHYAKGCSLAEAFYQAVHGPFQLLVLGDALCQPFAKPPQVTVSTDFSGRVTGELSYRVDLEPSSAPLESVQVYLDGRLLAQTTDLENMTLNTTKMADGYHELRLVAVGQGPIHSRSRQLFNLQVDNHGHSLELRSDLDQVDEGQRLQLSAESAGAESISIYCNTRRVGLAKGDKAVFKIDTKKLGRGPVELQAIAIVDGAEVRSRPLPVIITGPILDRIPETVPPK